MSTCAVLLSYKRPHNMQRIVDAVLDVSEIERVILSNNNPDIDIREWVDGRGVVEIINQPVRMLYTKRFEIANAVDCPFFFCPDDDTFLSSDQIRFLLDQLRRKPAVAHGMYGQLSAFRDGRFCLASGAHGVTCELDILNRVYCFTKQHLDRVMELSRRLGHASVNEAIYMEDVLLSHAGAARPICHDIGPFDQCPTSDLVGIATYKEDGFSEIRERGYRQLRELLGWRR
jgi:hypothetical protein